MLKLLVVFEQDEDGWEVAQLPNLFRDATARGRTREEVCRTSMRPGTEAT